jgi:hypothetical protein
MPGNPDGDELQSALLTTLRNVTAQMATLRAEVKEDMAQLLRSYREDTHRSIMGIHIRIVSLEDTIETDRGARIARQRQLDGELKGIRNNQTFWKRVGMVAALVTLGIVIGVWVL